jgi:hypothetical protein
MVYLGVTLVNVQHGEQVSEKHLPGCLQEVLDHIPDNLGDSDRVYK